MATTNSIKISSFGKESGTDRTYYIKWNKAPSNSKNHLVIDHYEVKWSYRTGGKWFTHTTDKPNSRTSKATAPMNADSFKAQVFCIYKTYKLNGKTKRPDKAQSDVKSVAVTAYPNTPSKPTLTLNASKKELTASVAYTGTVGNPTNIQFYLYANGKAKEYKDVKISKGKASVVFKNATDGTTYKVKCRAGRSKDKKFSSPASNWSDFSANVVTVPVKPTKFTDVKCSGATQIFVNWNDCSGATSYEVQAASNTSYFDGNPSAVKKQTVSVSFCYLDVDDSSSKWYVRVRAINAGGNSAWSNVYGVTIGTKPNPPSTWSSSGIAIIGQKITLYWAHNSEDDSDQTKYQVYVNGTLVTSGTGVKSSYEYLVASSKHSDGATVSWYVKTAGITGEFSNASTVRYFKAYLPANATADLTPVTLDEEGNRIITAYPVRLELDALPYTQTAIGYNVAVIANSDYDDYAYNGEEMPVSTGETVYTAYIKNGERTVQFTGDGETTGFVLPETADRIISVSVNGDSESVDYSLGTDKKTVTVREEQETELTPVTQDAVIEIIYKGEGNKAFLEWTPSNINLGSTADYKLVYDVAMDSGLTAECEVDFSTNITPTDYSFTAEFDEQENYVLGIRPICWYTADDSDDSDGSDDSEESTDDSEESIIAENVTLAVYRIDYNGDLILIADNIPNDGDTWVFDPHPSLNYSVYRIVSIDSRTGGTDNQDFVVQESDTAALQCQNVIIQWDENINNVTAVQDPEDPDNILFPDEKVWSGQMLEVVHNIDISTKYRQDVELVEYIGRKYPVSYRGTQLSDTSTFNMALMRDYDYFKLSQLRSLANYFGNCYIREPSGMGYPAHVNVTISQNYDSGAVPISLEVTRVEGDK